MYRFSQGIFSFIFLFILLISNNAFAVSKVDDRSYVYVQLGVGIDANSKLFISLKSYDGQKKKWETNNYHLRGEGDINPIISFGYYMNSLSLALESEYGVHTVFEKHINGKYVTGSDKEKAFATMNYFLINARKNIFTVFGNKNIVYGKVGFGVSMVNNITLNRSAAMNVPNPVIQLGAGFIRQVNNHIDIDLEYRYKVNISRRVQVSNGIKQIYQLQAHTITTSVRLKV